MSDQKPLSRRRLLQAAAAAPLSPSAGCTSPSSEKPVSKTTKSPLWHGDKRPPNVVLMMTDQQKALATGCYGNRLVPTAFQDRMAAEGVAFRNAYSTSPVCTPSRATLMTGVHPLVNQVTCVQNRAPWNLPQLAELMSDAGYYTAACGHYEPRRDLSRGWHTELDQNAPGELYKSWADWMAAGRSDVSWSAGALATPAERGNSALLTDWMLRALELGRETKAPLFLHLALNDPHPPYWVPKPYDTLVDPAQVKLYPKPDPAGQPEWHKRLIADNGSEKASELDRRKVISTYYGMIAYANDQMQRLYDAFAQAGMLDDTWFILTSDHGDFTGEHDVFAKCESLYECLLHIPLIIRPPNSVRMKRGEMIDGLVELTDVFPTILKLAGAEIPDYCQGHDLLSWMQQANRKPLRDCAFAQVGEYHGHLKTTWPGGMPESGRHKSLLQGGRTMDFAYTRDPDYGDEAYDLRNDRWELTNLLNPNQPAPPDEVKRLRDRVNAFEQECLALRKSLNIVPGDRGFWDGIQYQKKM